MQIDLVCLKIRIMRILKIETCISAICLVMNFTSCANDEIDELTLDGEWFLIESCVMNSYDGNDGCSDVELGTYIMSINVEEGKVVITKEGVIFPEATIEIKDSPLGRSLFINGFYRGRITSTRNDSFNWISNQINMIGPTSGTWTGKFIR